MEIDKVIENWPYWEVRLKDYLKSNPILIDIKYVVLRWNAMKQKLL